MNKQIVDHLASVGLARSEITATDQNHVCNGELSALMAIYNFEGVELVVRLEDGDDVVRLRDSALGERVPSESNCVGWVVGELGSEEVLVAKDQADLSKPLDEMALFRYSFGDNEAYPMCCRTLGQLLRQVIAIRDGPRVRLLMSGDGFHEAVISPTFGNDGPLDPLVIASEMGLDGVAGESNGARYRLEVKGEDASRVTLAVSDLNELLRLVDIIDEQYIWTRLA